MFKIITVPLGWMWSIIVWFFNLFIPDILKRKPPNEKVDIILAAFYPRFGTTEGATKKEFEKVFGKKDERLVANKKIPYLNVSYKEYLDNNLKGSKGELITLNWKEYVKKTKEMEYGCCWRLTTPLIATSTEGFERLKKSKIFIVDESFSTVSPPIMSKILRMKKIEFKKEILEEKIAKTKGARDECPGCSRRLSACLDGDFETCTNKECQSPSPYDFRKEHKLFELRMKQLEKEIGYDEEQFYSW